MKHTALTPVVAILVVGLVFVLGQLTAAEPSIKPGDTIVVLHDTHLQVGSEKLAPTASGTELVAEQVRGRWVWATIEHQEEDVSGWILDRHLVVHPERAFAKLVYGYAVPVDRPADEFGRINRDGDSALTVEELVAGTRLQTLDELNRTLDKVLGTGLGTGPQAMIKHVKLMAEIGNFFAWKRQLDDETEIWPMANDFVRTRDLRRSRVAQALVDRENPATRMHRARVLFEWADKNGDSTLTLDEFRQALPKPKQNVDGGEDD